MAKRGIGIYPTVELGFSEVPFYPWSNDEGLLESIHEADRALAAGAMEYVPECRIGEVMACSTIHPMIHPWTIVDQERTRERIVSWRAFRLAGHACHVLSRAGRWLTASRNIITTHTSRSIPHPRISWALTRV